MCFIVSLKCSPTKMWSRRGKVWSSEIKKKLQKTKININLHFYIVNAIVIIIRPPASGGSSLRPSTGASPLPFTGSGRLRSPEPLCVESNKFVKLNFVCVSSRSGRDNRHRCWRYSLCSYHHRYHHRRCGAALQEKVSLLSFFVNARPTSLRLPVGFRPN